MQDNQNTQDQNQVQPKTDVEYVEQMMNILREIELLDSDLKEVKDAAKERGYDPALLAKAAKALLQAKSEEIIAKNNAFEALVGKVQDY